MFPQKWKGGKVLFVVTRYATLVYIAVSLSSNNSLVLSEGKSLILALRQYLGDYRNYYIMSPIVHDFLALT